MGLDPAEPWDPAGPLGPDPAPLVPAIAVVLLAALLALLWPSPVSLPLGRGLGGPCGGSRGLVETLGNFKGGPWRDQGDPGVLQVSLCGP